MKLSYRFRISLDLFAHVVCTAMLGWVVYLKTADLFYVGIVVAGGIFIDLDHLIDYFRYFKNKKFSLKNFFYGLYLGSGKVYLFFHSWELIFIILALATFFRSYVLLLFFLSLSIHLLIDNTQRRKKLFYFFTYRFLNGFKVDIILPEVKDYITGINKE